MHTLYIANKNYSSWSLRPWLLLQQLGIPFEEVLVPFSATGDDHGYQAFSPTARVPCLVDGEVVVWDSLAITEYLAETHPQVRPVERVARAWARSACAEMHAGFGQIRSICTMNCGLRVRLHAQPLALLAEWQRMDALWSQGLARFGGPFLAGAAFTAADAFFAPVAFRVQTYGPALSPVAQDYAARLRALPAMQRWYADALAEPWRHEGHEAEARAVGETLQDLRTPG